VTELEEFRGAKDEFFRDDLRSPLTMEQRKAFPGLSYFPESEELRIEADLDLDVDRNEEIVMQTTTGETQSYRRAGKVRLTIDGESAELTLYESPDQDDLFVPFRDATSGRETYGAGRYLEVERPHDGRVLLDFNLAYNPYFAYNPEYSCPLPPGENWLSVPIQAGERAFMEGHGIT
jgi:uncharacterized protein